jgi:hypothetical protein
MEGFQSFWAEHYAQRKPGRYEDGSDLQFDDSSTDVTIWELLNSNEESNGGFTTSQVPNGDLSRWLAERSTADVARGCSPGLRVVWVNVHVYSFSYPLQIQKECFELILDRFRIKQAYSYRRTASLACAQAQETSEGGKTSKSYVISIVEQGVRGQRTLALE